MIEATIEHAMMSRTEPSEVVAGVVTGVLVEVRDLQRHRRAGTADRAALVGACRFQGTPRVALMPLGAGIAGLPEPEPIDEVFGRAHNSSSLRFRVRSKQLAGADKHAFATVAHHQRAEPARATLPNVALCS